MLRVACLQLDPMISAIYDGCCENSALSSYVPGCTKKTIISIRKIGTEETCNYRHYPSEFSSAQLLVLQQTAISAFYSLMQAGAGEITTCAKNRANINHGTWNLASGLSYPYNLDNLGNILDRQLYEWSTAAGPSDRDFNIHLMVNFASKKRFVLGHSTIGRIVSDFDHVKVQNVDQNRFEIHVNSSIIPANATDSPTTIVLSDTDENGDVLTFNQEVSSRFLASTLSHEMMHQMGLLHTKNSSGKDFQDDFVYSVGECVYDNHLPIFEWNEAAGI
jgi:hypothetical protein